MITLFFLPQCHLNSNSLFHFLSTFAKFPFSHLLPFSFSPFQITTPEIVRENILFGTGFNPRQRHSVPSPSSSESSAPVEKEDDNQIYQILGTNMALIGTSEIPLVGMNSNSILPSEKVVCQNFFQRLERKRAI